MILFKGALHQTLAAINALLSLFVIGHEIGWMAPVIIKLQKGELNLSPTDADISWLASLHDIGRIFGPIFSAIFLDKVGRKCTSLLCSFLFVVTWLAVMYAGSILIMCTLRVLLGAVQGLAEVTASIYVAENCTPYMRGILGSLLPLAFFAGVIFEYIVAAFVGYRTLALVNAAAAAVTLATGVLLKETPYFLVMRGRLPEALENLAWLRGGSDVRPELQDIQRNIESEQRTASTVALLAEKRNVKIMVTIFMVHALVIMTGIAPINGYVSSMLRSSPALSADEYTIVFGICQFAGACISPFIIERCNRRTLLMTSLLVMGLAHGCTAMLYTLRWDASPYFPWLIFATVTAYSTTFALNFPIMFIIRSEVLPTGVRAIGGSLGIMTDSVVAFATAWLYTPVAVRYGMQYNFWFYCASSFAAIIYVFLLLPETRGRSLVDIEKSLKNT